MSASVTFSPLGLVLLPTLFLVITKFPKRHGDSVDHSRVSLVRRFGAFYLDLAVAIMGVILFTCMMALATEYYATGHWQWSYERDFYRPTDVIDLAASLLGFVGIFYYFKWHFDRREQTLGQHLFGFKLISEDANPSLARRGVVALTTVAWWPFWPRTLFGRKQDYLWDTASRIKARRVRRR